MEGRNRIDDAPVHKALREALGNCLINADYYGTRVVVIKKDQDRIIFENPGYIRTGKEQMRRGGESDPRNKTLMKMFNLINIGERSGSGGPNIFNTWNDQGWKEPVIEERFDPDRTTLTLEFINKTNEEKMAKKTSEENKRRKQVKKGRHTMEKYVSLKNVSKIYRMGEVEIRAVDGIDFDIEKGEFVVIVGPSGAGKTTVLNILGGMDTATSGQVLVDGSDIAKYSQKQLTGYRRDDIGFVFQFYNLIPNLTALENVELAL